MKTIFLTTLLIASTVFSPAFAGSKKLSAAKLNKILSSESRMSAQVTREYVRNGETVVSLTWEKEGGGFVRYSVTVNTSGIAMTRKLDFINAFREQMQEAAGRVIHVGPTPTSDDDPRSMYPKAYSISSGMRHPMNTSEASKYFLAADKVLNNLLENVTVKDTEGSVQASEKF